MNTGKLLIKPGSKVKLSDWDPDDTHGYSKEQAEQELIKHQERLTELQEVLYAEGRHALLVILQGMDASGKDGTIRHVMSRFNPLACVATPFKVPTAEELSHDFLWRIHKVAPRKGHIGIFNRSHYEDVLVVRVHKLVPKSVWSERYDHVNNFERLLSEDSSVSILKFYLQISKEEQKKRLEERLNDPHKQWKVNPNDFEERKLWGDYMEAYEDALCKCSTDWAPWYIIPADKKWFRNLAVSQIIVETLEGLKLKYPKPDFDPSKIKIE
jgi:PPK2 family polyphosphate:nucleotide phosphotransferase